MDPVTILTVAGMAFTAAEKAGEAGIALGRFINDVKYIDNTIGLLVTEVNALSAACDLVGSRIKGIAEAMDGVGPDSKKESPLWLQVRSQLEDCNETVSALYEAVKDVGLEKKKNPFAQAWRQIQLNMKTKDIEDSRNRIRSHTASLQLVLQAITLELSYLAPHKADQQLLVLLENIRDIKQELSQMRNTSQETSTSDSERRHDQKEDELIKYTDKIISSGETLYEGSIAGGSVIGPTEGLDEKISSWVSRLQVLNSDSTITESEDYDTRGSSVSGADIGTMTDITSDSGMEARPTEYDDLPENEEEGDDLEIEMIKEAYSLGALEFQHKDYSKANMLLQEVLTMVEESPMRSGRMLDIRELRWMLAVCAYHTDDFQAAEAALKEIVQIPPQGQDDRVRLCEAGHILALVSLKQNKLAEARQYCDSALQGRRRLLGKQDPACYESLALLARIFDLQDNSARASIYSRMIPEDQREKICAQFENLGTPTSALAGDKKSEAEEKELPPLPPGPPPYVPATPSTISEPSSATSTTSPGMQPEQRWKFRPPIPTASPVDASPVRAATPQKKEYDDDDDEPIFPPASMQGSISSIINGPPKQPEPNTLGRTTTLPAPANDHARPAVARAQSVKTPTSNIQQEAESLAKVQAYKDEALRTQKKYGKKSTPARNAVQMFASAVLDMDLRRPSANSFHEDLVRFIKNNFDDTHPLIYKAYANLAKIAENNGDFNKSSDYYQIVLDGMRKNSADDGVKGVQTQVAETYVEPDKPELSYAALRAELKSRRKQYGSRLRSAETADVAKLLREYRQASKHKS